jgi:hypothetical protein
MGRNRKRSSKHQIRQRQSSLIKPLNLPVGLVVDSDTDQAMGHVQPSRHDVQLFKWEDMLKAARENRSKKFGTLFDESVIRIAPLARERALSGVMSQHSISGLGKDILFLHKGLIRDETQQGVSTLKHLTIPSEDLGCAQSNRSAALGTGPDPLIRGTQQVCSGIIRQTADSLALGGENWGATPLLDASLTFRLHSNPTASKIIYLDFDGHITSGTSWNNGTMGSSFVSPAYDIDGATDFLSVEELARIQQIWQRVASDYSPFDVDVTTQAPPSDWLAKTDGGDIHHGIRVVVTSFGPSSTSGGIAFVDSFNWDSDTPAFVYNKSVVEAAEACSHEVGHALGLSHDGTSSSSYYLGLGSGETGWAPIMGAGYYKNVTTWDNGVYAGSTNTGAIANYGKGGDDLAVITGYNGFGYVQDLEGSSLASASLLTVNANAVRQFGRIETSSDQDWYRFSLASDGSLDLSIDPYWYRAYVDADGLWGGDLQAYIAPFGDVNLDTPWPENSANLDVAASLYSNEGILLSASSLQGLRSSISIDSLQAGSYYLMIEGSGCRDALTRETIYTSYGSLGNYCISGAAVNAIDQVGGSSGLTIGNPPSAVLPYLSISNVSVTEGTSSASKQVSARVVLSATAQDDVTVAYTTSDGSAISQGTGQDYVGSSGSVVIPKGQLAGDINITVISDAIVESDEWFAVALDKPVNAIILAGVANVTIVNDDVRTVSSRVKGGGKSRAMSETIMTGNDLSAIDEITGIKVGDTATTALVQADLVDSLGSQSYSLTDAIIDPLLPESSEIQPIVFPGQDTSLSQISSPFIAPLFMPLLSGAAVASQLPGSDGIGVFDAHIQSTLPM